MEKYICFYTQNCFWAGEKPNISIIASDPELFTQSLSAKVFCYENDDVYLAICKDGLIMTQIKNLDLRRSEIESEEKDNFLTTYTSEYINYLNTIQLILSSSALKIAKLDCFNNSNIQVGDAFCMFFDCGQLSGSGALANITSTFYYGRYRSQYSERLPIQFDRRITLRLTIDESVFSSCFDDVNKIIRNIEAIHILSQINNALSQYKILNFTQGFIQSWFVIEYFMNKMWKSYLDSKDITFPTGEKRISNNRNKYFTNLKIADVLNQLELNDYITYEQFKIIDSLRKKRNTLVHNIAESRSNYQDCEDAFCIIKDLVKREYGFNLEISTSLSYSPF